MKIKQKPSRSISIAFLLLNVLLWGAALPIVKPALDVTTPSRYLFYRFFLAGLLSLPILWYYWPKVKNKTKAIGQIVLLEILGTTVALWFLYAGLARTSSIEAGLIATTTPIFITIGGIWYLKEKQERREWWGLSIALLGTVLLSIEPLLTGRNGHAQFSFTGNVLVFIQNILIAAYYVLAKKYYAHLPKLFVTGISFFVGMLSFFLISLAETATINIGVTQQLVNFLTLTQLELTQSIVLLPVLYMAIFGSIIGLTAYIKGQDGIEASEASLFTYLQPLVYIPLSLIFLKEVVTWPMLLAVAIIAVGVFVAEKRTPN